MPGEPLGDLIVELKLDDDGFQETLAAATEEGNKRLLQFSRSGNDAERVARAMGRAAQEAHARFGVMANATVGLSTAMRLLGVEQGLVAVESGRLVLYFGRAITSGGGVAAMFGTISSAIKGFMVSIGPVGWAITTLTLLFVGYKKIMGESADVAEESAKRRTKALEDEKRALWDAQTGYLKLLDANRLARGQISPAEFERNELVRGGVPFNEATQLGAQIVEARNEAAGIANLQKMIADQWELAEKQEQEAIDERMERENKYWAETRKNADQAVQEFMKAEEAKRKAIEDTTRDMQVRFGGANPSDFLTGQARELALFGESAAARLKAAGEPGAGFGIGSVDASQFRFGPGAIGSVIGQQNEQANTTRAVKDAGKESARLLRELLAVWKSQDAASVDSVGFDWVLR